MPLIRTSPSGPRIGAFARVGGLYLRRTLIATASVGSHLCLPQTTHAWVRGGGGGGAGGGADGAVSNTSASGGAGGAGVFEKLIELTTSRSIDYIIGAGGVGVIGGVGTDGANTTVTYGSISLVGFGSVGRGVGTSSNVFVILGTSPGALATGGDANYQGGPSTPGFRVSASAGQGGNGGQSDEAPGGRGPSVTSNVSADGESGQFGSGGGGAVNCNNSPVAGNKGGNGGTGFLWVYEIGEAIAA